MKRAIFLDRDGTLNVDRGYTYRVEDFKWIPGSLEALELLTRHGFDLFVVTNQAGIARGLYTEEDFHVLTRYMMEVFKEEGIFVKKILFCPHHPEGTLPQYTRVCDCRKPGTRLLERVLDEYAYNPLNCILIGDKNSDIEAGRKMKMTTYLVETGFGFREKTFTLADKVFADLNAATSYVLKEGKGES